MESIEEAGVVGVAMTDLFQAKFDFQFDNLHTVLKFLLDETAKLKSSHGKEIASLKRQNARAMARLESVEHRNVQLEKAYRTLKASIDSPPPVEKKAGDKIIVNINKTVSSDSNQSSSHTVVTEVVDNATAVRETTVIETQESESSDSSSKTILMQVEGPKSVDVEERLASRPVSRKQITDQETKDSAQAEETVELTETEAPVEEIGTCVTSDASHRLPIQLALRIQF